MKPFRLRGAALGLIIILLLLPGCGQDQQETAPPPEPAETEVTRLPGGCRGCHSVSLDPAHDLGCTSCHAGDGEAVGREAAHAGLIARPAHPDLMARTCGKCHSEAVAEVADSLHFTLRNEVNAVREVFGAGQPLPSLTAIPVSADPDTPLALADDLLRRRCLRCHVYYEGDQYPETRRGTGCAACHLSYSNGALRSHLFTKWVPDDQCLHCHYGNRVGADYYGRYEHDFDLDYRTPYPTGDGERFPRPYGLEYHQLMPDIHQKAGLACVDCHGAGELMAAFHTLNGLPRKITCESCHAWQPGQPLPPGNLRQEGGALLLTTRQGLELAVPPLRHPAHRTYAAEATCVLCHAQWSYNDQGTHLMRHDIDDYEPWLYLTTQGCYEVEVLLENNLWGDEDLLPQMTDKITGQTRAGIWYKGFEQRRWEFPLICRDPENRLTICRPILDLHLSYVNEQNEIVFDSIPGQDIRGGIRPYTPHTIGRAGAFFRERLQEQTAPAGDFCPLEDEENK